MTDVLLGLSADSRTILDCYLRWSSLARENLRRGVSFDASSHNAGNLLRETYTLDELKEILNGHTAVLLHSLDARVERFVASSAELLRGVLGDADRQRVAIKVDASALLDGPASLLSGHERQLLAGPRGRLAPLTVADVGGEARRQLEESGEEMRRLREKLHDIANHHGQAAGTRAGDAGVSSLTTVDGLRAELAAAKKELNTRLNHSTQYQQLKGILAKKNEQIKALRARLALHDPEFLRDGEAVAGDIVVDEDD